MRSNRRAARLTALWAVLAVGAGIASVWIPVSRGALAPSILELTVGWTLLIASLLLALGTPTTAAMLGPAGLTWIGVGLAPFAGTIGQQVFARMALVPTALIATAAIVGPRRWPTGYRLVLVVLVASTAIVAGAGWYRFSILIIGLLTLASAVPGTRSTDSGSDRVRFGFGGGLIAVGAVAVADNAASPQFVANLHDIVLIAATAAITLVARRERTLSVTDGIELGEPSALAESLSVALGCGPLTIAFPGPAGTWLDPSGRTQTPRSPGGPVHSVTGTTIAWLSPAVDLDPESAVTIRRVLETASDTATLREGLRRRAAEIDRSSERLQTAAEGEHARLVVLLESGPLAALARAGTLLTPTASGRRLSARVAEAERVLTDVVRGLHPAEADAGLIDAIARLTDRSHATFVIDSEVDPEVDLGTTEREVVWFTCAEGLANATKHAPGSAIVVRLETGPSGYVLTVSDEGPGGADASGSGLSGLRERAEAVHGNLTVESGKDGTTLRLLVPAREEIACFHVAGTASAPIRTPIEFGTVGT